MSVPDFEAFPRPRANYYETRHDYLTQGDILRNVPFSQMGPSLTIVDPPPEGLPVPEGHITMLSYVWISPLAMVISDTCDFRHPSTDDIERHPAQYHKPDAIYHSGFIRVAPIIRLDEYENVPAGEDVRDRIRHFDHFRRLMYLPAWAEGEGRRVMIPESVVAIHMTDLNSLDVVRRLDRVTQLTRVARQQLNRKLVYCDTGFQIPLDEFEPDLS